MNKRQKEIKGRRKTGGGSSGDMIRAPDLESVKFFGAGPHDALAPESRSKAQIDWLRRLLSRDVRE